MTLIPFIVIYKMQYSPRLYQKVKDRTEEFELTNEGFFVYDGSGQTLFLAWRDMIELKIEGGEVEIYSHAGLFTSFSIHLPQSIALIAGIRYGMDAPYGDAPSK
jgi:hypothetical protein